MWPVRLIVTHIQTAPFHQLSAYYSLRRRLCTLMWPKQWVTRREIIRWRKKGGGEIFHGGSESLSVTHSHFVWAELSLSASVLRSSRLYWNLEQMLELDVWKDHKWVSREWQTKKERAATRRVFWMSALHSRSGSPSFR